MPPIVDPEKNYQSLTKEQRTDVLSEVLLAWDDACQGRVDHEQRALQNHKLYRRIADEVTTARQERGGWSKLRIPLIFWLVETQMSRVGVAPPTVTVTPKSEAAVPHALAKQMRMNHYLQQQRWKLEAMRIAKTFLVLGDAPVKVPWDQDRKIPRMLGTGWWDFFMSPDTKRWEESEWFFHRTYWTKRQLETLEMARAETASGKKGRRLWMNLEHVINAGAGPDVADPTYAERKETSGYSRSPRNDHLGSLVEGWHRDGSYIAFSPEAVQLIRAEVSPFHDQHGRIQRPFVMFTSTPDLDGAYSVPMPEILEDHEIELSTLRNQMIDQITSNLNSPVVYDGAIPDEDVDDAFAQPNGKLRVENYAGDVLSAVKRMPPGQVSGDFPMFYEQSRSESQMTSGVSDIASGQSSIQGLSNQTATGMSIISGESNKRMQMLLMLQEIAMGDVARLFDSHDRQFGGALFVPTEASPELGVLSGQEAEGIRFLGPGFAAVAAASNEPSLEYEIVVDAGSMQRPDQLEKTQEIVNFVGVASHPAIAPQMNWPEIARALVQAHGFNEDKMILSPDQQPPPPPPEGEGGAPPPPEQNGGPPAPVEEPVGPAVPVA